MTYHEIFEEVKKSLSKAKASAVNGNVAFEFDIIGEGEGKFYVEVKDGAVNVEPYDYRDNNACLIAEADVFIKIVKGELKPESAYADGQLKIGGDVGKALELKALIDSIPSPKKRRTKAEIEADKLAKEEEKKAKEAEKAAKAAEKAAAKEAAPKKAPVKKVSAKTAAKED